VLPQQLAVRLRWALLSSRSLERLVRASKRGLSSSMSSRWVEAPARALRVCEVVPHVE